MGDTIIKRYFAKIFSRVFSILSGLITFGIVPRALGPEAYGNFGYLKVYFSRLIQFFQFRTDIAFFIKFSKNQKEKKIIGFFTYYLLLIFFVTLCFVFITTYTDLGNYFFPGQSKVVIYLVFISSSLSFFVKNIRNTIDVLGLTIKNEYFLILGSILSALAILAAYHQNFLSLNVYILIGCLSSLFILLYGVFVLKSYGNINRKDFKITSDERISYKNDFINYVKPLLVISLIIFFSTIFDRWLIQKFYGSKEQGYFVFASKLGDFLFILSSSLIPLLQREFAVEIKNKNFEKVKEIYKNFSQLLFSISVFFGSFIAANSKSIITIIAGKEYLEAHFILVLIIFYNIYRTKTQFATTFFYAMDDTSGLRNNNIITYSVAMPLAFFLIYDGTYFGLGLGSIGLSIKLIIAQHIGLVLMLKKINETFKENILNMYLKDFLFFGLCMAIAMLSKYLISDQLSLTVMMIISFILYLVLVFLLCFIFPHLLGMNKVTFYKYFFQLKQNLK